MESNKKETDGAGPIGWQGNRISAKKARTAEIDQTIQPPRGRVRHEERGWNENSTLE
jgi:hypothetical protein